MPASAQLIPTRLTLQILLQKLKAATKGHKVLKNKADGLRIRFQVIIGQIIKKKETMGTYMREASISLVASKIAVSESNFQHVVLEDVDVATYKLHINNTNVLGVRLPVFESRVIAGQSKQYAGLSQGGGKIKNCRELYYKALESLVEIASLQTSFVTLDNIIKTTNRRVNAIEHVIKPRLENSILRIQTELEELEREEMFRLKKIQQKKDKELAQKRAELAAKGIKLVDTEKSLSNFESANDEIDVLF